MELSKSVLTGLEVVGSAAALDGESFKKVIQLSLTTALDPSAKLGNECYPEANEGAMSAKETCFALSTLLLELARIDANTMTISTLLEEVKIDQEREKVITETFLEHKAELRASLERLSSAETAHLIDTQWRLDYYMKNNHTEKINRAEFIVELQTQQASGESTVQFACTQEQIQDLVSKLKDATKSLEKFSQQN